MLHSNSKIIQDSSLNISNNEFNCFFIFGAKHFQLADEILSGGGQFNLKEKNFVIRCYLLTEQIIFIDVFGY